MMNTLANHGFLHRDGLNLTEDHVIQALGDGLNFDKALAEKMFEMALPANPDPNATWFSLYATLLILVESSLSIKLTFHCTANS